MLSSKKNKDVAALQPVKNLAATILHESLIKVLFLVQKAGFKAVAVISDNNRVNWNEFEKMCGGVLLQSSIPHQCEV